jgi:hypothetical protein
MTIIGMNDPEITSHKTGRKDAAEKERSKEENKKSCPFKTIK